MPVIFDADDAWTFPALGRRVVAKGGDVVVEAVTEAWAEYDTAHGDLASSAVQLARTPSNWLLTVDGETKPYPAVGRGVPAELRDLLFGARAGAGLRIARRVTRERAVHAVFDAAGTEVGKIADVYERTAAGGTAATLTHRRYVEVLGWDGPFPAAAAKALTKAGAVPVSTPEPSPPDTVGAAIRHEIAVQRRAILAGDLALRRGEPAVHRTRIAIRRLRSVLRVVPVTEPAATAALDAELCWLAAQLAEVRDREVLRAHLDTVLAKVDGVPAATVTLIDDVLDREHRTAQGVIAKVLISRRYVALLRTLRAWSEEPPFEPGAAAPAERLAKYLQQAERTLARRVRRADDDAGLHRARKAGKRLRYAADLVPGRLSSARHAKALQKRLGEHQDAVVAAAFLARVGASASGEAAFGCGVLWAYEARRAGKARRASATRS